MRSRCNQLGVLHAHADPPDAEQAEAHYQQAMALADELGMRPLMAHCHLGLGRLYGQTGRREPARAALATAIDLYRTMDMAFWLPQAEAVLAQVEAVRDYDAIPGSGACPPPVEDRRAILREASHKCREKASLEISYKAGCMSIND